MTLGQLALNLVQSGGLPQFPGATIPEKLFNGRAHAEIILRKYVPGFVYDEDNAREVMSRVNIWVMRNEASLNTVMASSSTSMPHALQETMGNSNLVQQWVIANFTLAAQGLGPWQSGRVGAEVANPKSKISGAWADTDAQSRLDSFGMILKMERDGDLEYIFRGPSAVSGTGFGIANVVVWAIVVTVVMFAAVVLTYYYMSKRLELNNAIMKELCEKAQEEGDKATVDKWLEASRDLQMASPWKSLTSAVGRVALILCGTYLAAQYLLPFILEIGRSHV